MVARLTRAAQALHRLYVVDNTPHLAVPHEAWPPIPAPTSGVGTSHVHVLRQGHNLGLAHALNRGVTAAFQGGATHVLLLDQDSTIPSELPDQLSAAWHVAHQHSAQLAAIGPAFVDSRGGAPMPHATLKGWLGYQRALPWSMDPRFCQPYMLITSGTVLSAQSWAAIGPFRADLFIDNIDLEWSLRATHQGWVVLGCPWLHMPHELGQRRVRVPGLSRPLITHPPQRLYYIMRNRVLLYRMPHVPWAWVWRDLIRIPPKLLLTTLWVAPRWAGLRAMLQGLWHGLLGRSGPRPG
jgi:rhamnosyltransferase